VPLNASGIDLVLRKSEIRGQVIDAVTGGPIEQFELRVSREIRPDLGPQDSRPFRTWSSYTTPDGQFVLPVFLDTVQIEARAPGYEWKLIGVEAPRGEVLEDLAIELSPGWDVYGTVLDAATEQPIEGARVAVGFRPISQWKGIQDDQFDAVTGPDGSFNISGRAAGETVNLQAWCEGYAPEFVFGHKIAFGRDARILLSRGGTLRGRVFPDGEPVTRLHGSLVYGIPGQPGRVNFQASAFTSDDGSYMMSGLPYGRYELRIVKELSETSIRAEMILAATWVDIEDGVTVELEHDLADYSVVHGRLPDLESYDGVVVALCDARYPFEPLYLSAEAYDTSGPDANGEFRFGLVPPGEYIVRARIPGDPPTELEEHCEVSPGDTLGLVLELP
jgi:hypothetical protein